LEDLEERPWAAHSQRAQFLFAVLGARVSEVFATTLGFEEVEFVD
jgi:hypothetical protein